ncbi:amino acid ABC transporter permease [Enterococcus dongliensis]|uniref:Amino acid ABC transporter permease n=1 Tax=Enterococcus dongliensis TaxID=2559925 RepID=A0AAP5NLX7_9ENTE|nr:amino acid ABC transporter permease [Enterococcus dongliensis]MDT2597160.1 amino acid ABC transporter permease [Enterococcus dongliensis]MDT2604451.1 amino acid ABC transporter permease [Enterococcus dongliensis]MDT2635519.1 amino acid ABC transporter permease [Enterococcus dongliensis]MDT2638113.1 amino acid ABC transporter permease [Enterococcus dongliensis]MDT2642965.1 amino acid ABC transporter permease [Enterococcus dongliensis]
MVRYDWSKVWQTLPQLIEYVPKTLLVIGLTVLLGTILGFLVSWGTFAPERTIRRLAESYIFILRCTPPIVLLFLVFYGLPKLLFWWLGIQSDEWSRTAFAVIALTLLFAAMISKVFISAYSAVPKGQTEASLSVGLTQSQTFRRIILPQAFRIALPNFSTALLNLMKDAALAYTIGLIDVLGGANLLISRNFGNHSLEVYSAAAIIYWVMALIIALGTQGLEILLIPQRKGALK